MSAFYPFKEYSRVKRDKKEGKKGDKCVLYTQSKKTTPKEGVKGDRSEKIEDERKNDVRYPF